MNESLSIPNPFIDGVIDWPSYAKFGWTVMLLTIAGAAALYLLVQHLERKYQ